MSLLLAAGSGPTIVVLRATSKLAVRVRVLQAAKVSIVGRCRSLTRIRGVPSSMAFLRGKARPAVRCGAIQIRTATLRGRSVLTERGKALRTGATALRGRTITEGKSRSLIVSKVVLIARSFDKIGLKGVTSRFVILRARCKEKLSLRATTQSSLPIVQLLARVKCKVVGRGGLQAQTKLIAHGSILTVSRPRTKAVTSLSAKSKLGAKARGMLSVLTATVHLVGKIILKVKARVKVIQAKPEWVKRYGPSFMSGGGMIRKDDSPRYGPGRRN